MKVHNRTVVLSMVGGSVNRNLNDESSDRDEKYFVLPTFEDLYNSKVYKDFKTTNALDTEVHDVRRLDSLLYKSNLAYLELLYSVELNTHGYPDMELLVGMREDVANMNLQYFFGSCLGMYNRQSGDMFRANSQKQQEVLKQYGYNPKKAMMSKHFLNVLQRYHKQGFQDFGSCLWYEGKEREFMLEMKHGSMSKGEAVSLLKQQEQEVLKLKEDYYNQPFQQETYDKLKRLLYGLVKREMVKEL